MLRPFQLSTIFISLLLFCGFGFAQSKTQDMLSGQVVLDDGQPAAKATVEITSVGLRKNREQKVECDETGNFKLPGLMPGSYSITAFAPGYISAEDASVRLYRPGETAIIRLTKGAVITGRVTDATGEPLVGAGINLLRLRDLNGKRVRNGDSSAWGRIVETDDRGIYRAYGLLPGSYIVSVEVVSSLRWVGESDNEPPTYYPSTTRDAAMEITVRPGEEVSNIDIRYRNSSGHAISGTILGMPETTQPFGNPGITLLNTATREVVSTASAFQSQIFVLFGIPDGDYELYARFIGRREQVAAGSAPQKVSVRGADVTGLTLRMVAYGTISGRVVIESAKPAASEANKCETAGLTSVTEILLEPQSERRNPRTLNALLAETDKSENRVAPDEKGEFTLPNLEPDTYRLEADLPGDNWFVRSMTLTASGAAKTKTDIARSPINLKAGEKLAGVEITVASGAASLAGRAVPAKESGNSPARLRVHLIPSEAIAADDVLRYRELLIEPNGSFEFKQLAPGKYWLLARPVTANDKDNSRPAAFDSTERIKLRREAEASKQEIELLPCQRVKDFALKF